MPSLPLGIRPDFTQCSTPLSKSLHLTPAETSHCTATSSNLRFPLLLLRSTSPLYPSHRHIPANMSQRAGFRLLQRASQQQPTFRTAFRQPFFRRKVATADGPVTDATTTQSGFAKLWNSPVGPKTVHFWYAPMTLTRVLLGYVIGVVQHH